MPILNKGTIFLKKYILFIISLFLSTFLYAANLECSKSYLKFSKLLEEKVNLLTNSDIEGVLAFKDKHAYSSLFNANHPNQKFSTIRWISNDEYVSMVKKSMQMMKTGDFRFSESKLFPIKYNGIIRAGEICIIPIESTAISKGRELKHKDYYIYIRDLQSNEWRSIIYLDQISKENFNEFFPDFPQGLDLSK